MGDNRPMTTTDRPLSAGRLILIRHGETDHNAGQVLAGWTDSALSARGLQQTVHLGAHVVGRYRLDRLYASPLQRAWQTALAISTLAGLAATALDDLREIHLGDLEGLEFAAFEARHPELHQRWLAGDGMDLLYPGGESRFQFRERVTRALAPLEAESIDATVAVVCHGGVIGSYLAHRIAGDADRWREFHVRNCSVTEIGWRAGEPVVVRQDCILHLTEAGMSEPRPGLGRRA
jgi:broad specificity phosphatase PhoE